VESRSACGNSRSGRWKLDSKAPAIAPHRLRRTVDAKNERR